MRLSPIGLASASLLSMGILLILLGGGQIGMVFHLKYVQEGFMPAFAAIPPVWVVVIAFGILNTGLGLMTLDEA